MSFLKVKDLIDLLSAYFPPDMPAQRALHALGSLFALRPIAEMNEQQRRCPHQSNQTAWENHLAVGFNFALKPEELYSGRRWDGKAPHDEEMQVLKTDLLTLYDFLPWTTEDIKEKFKIDAPPLLITRHHHCIVCNEHTPLYGYKPGLVAVSFIDKDLVRKKAQLAVAQCSSCLAIYHPDRIAYKLGPVGARRVQRLDCDAEYLLVSKNKSVWVHCRIAKCQEVATYRFRASWAGVTDFLNQSFLTGKTKLTEEQGHHMFVEHMARRLIKAHNLETVFQSLLEHIGRIKGIVPGALQHICQECTHQKRYKTDLTEAGVNLGIPSHIVADGEDQQDIELPAPEESETYEELHALPDPNGLPQQQPPPEGQERGYVQMAVTDGKTLKFRICAVPGCRGPLTNYATGRFCSTHIVKELECGVNACSTQVRKKGDFTCDNPIHIAKFYKYKSRFGNNNFLNVRRAISKKKPDWLPTSNNDGTAIEEEADEGHTFRARTTYCLQTIQWACGVPISWGICYESESPTQVFELLQYTWPKPEDRPAFIAYDKACKLLAHIATHLEKRDWLQTTRFVVDAWHYINHRVTDVLCRTWCNPNPSDGSQPDLVIPVLTANGESVLARAFNTETAEQLNAWMDGFEAQMRQMADYNFGFESHCTMLLYKEAVAERITEKKQWIYVDEDMNVDI
ncbi:hypothetical protein M422DRAFT_276636 [Sphaerobolus stellatus SS14]|uniref:CxC5 like cysteine cluster associated with KDZ domain-containing protein n=1 Tax=Sphaerobolus stellatus (strain SS14) TaxID=990650 RepID=A0A0C9UCU0_SPHS4|nr:hypothetical protein M422DRAFT_276636 [Sphaerobolus stellatus SS14]